MRTPLLPVAGFAAALGMCVLGCSGTNPLVVTRTNQDAALTSSLPSNPYSGKVITSWIDKQNSTMSILFGNDVAIAYARSSPRQDYPSGSVLSLVTWNERDDPRWFGGRIPATPKSVEFVTVGTAPDAEASYSYEQYEGSPLKKIAAERGLEPNDRAAYLLAQRAAVLP